MPLTLSVGLTRKVGQPAYGSLGASCQVAFELEGSLLQRDPSAFQQQARAAFLACQQAVEEELARQQAAPPAPAPAAAETPSSGGFRRNGHTSHAATAQNGIQTRPATPSQARAIRALAGRRRLALGELLRGRFGVAGVEELSLVAASRLIDELKDTSCPAEAPR